MMDKQLIARLRVLEKDRGMGLRQGLAFLQVLIELEGDGQRQYQDADVIALDVGGFDSQQGRVTTRFTRRSGESLADLEARANPRGCWRAAPTPVFRNDSESTDGRVWKTERDEVLWLTMNNTEGRGL